PLPGRLPGGRTWTGGLSAREALADRQQQPGGRRVSARVRRRRTVAAAVALLVVVLAAWLVARPSSAPAPKNVPGTPRRALSPAQAVVAPGGLRAAEAGLMPWHLAAPISREVVVASAPGQLIVLGGLTAAGGSANGGSATGASRHVGALSAPLPDAAAGVLGGRALVFGGGSPATVATVQAFTLPGPGSGTRGATATTAGSMAPPRADAAAV